MIDRSERLPATGPAIGWDEPTREDLEAIEAEWPLLAAELAVVSAQCRLAACPDVLARRALRRAVTARNRAAVAVVNHPLVPEALKEVVPA